MYYIQKYHAGVWAIHNDETGESRKLSEEEKKKAGEKYPTLLNDKTVKHFFDDNFLTVHDRGAGV